MLGMLFGDGVEVTPAEEPDLKLEKVKQMDDDAAISATRENATGFHFQVSVPRYGSGTLSFLVT